MARSKQLEETRRNEIIASARKLYKVKSFKEITIKDIASDTSFTRPSIYNYFETKEEIFLAILKEEYDKWRVKLEKIREDHERLSRADFASLVSDSLDESEMMLKLLTMNLYDMEENSRYLFLLDLKRSYKAALDEVSSILKKFFNYSEEECENFLYLFFPFVFGVYPYAEITEKQEKAMREAGIIIHKERIKDFVYKACLCFLKEEK